MSTHLLIATESSWNRMCIDSSCSSMAAVDIRNSGKKGWVWDLDFYQSSRLNKFRRSQQQMCSYLGKVEKNATLEWSYCAGRTTILTWSEPHAIESASWGVRISKLGIHWKQLERGDEKGTMRFNYYPASPRPDKVWGLLAHREPSMVSILHQDSVGGLHVKRAATWVARRCSCAFLLRRQCGWHAWGDYLTSNIPHLAKKGQKKRYVKTPTSNLSEAIRRTFEAPQ